MSEKDEDNSSMKNITINIPFQYDTVIQWLINEGIVPNRSEAIRMALRQFLFTELENLEQMNGFKID